MAYLYLGLCKKKKGGGVNMNEEYEKNQDDKIYIIFNVLILHKNVVQS